MRRVGHALLPAVLALLALTASALGGAYPPGYDPFADPAVESLANVTAVAGTLQPAGGGAYLLQDARVLYGDASLGPDGTYRWTYPRGLDFLAGLPVTVYLRPGPSGPVPVAVERGDDGWVYFADERYDPLSDAMEYLEGKELVALGRGVMRELAATIPPAAARYVLRGDPEFVFALFFQDALRRAPSWGDTREDIADSAARVVEAFPDNAFLRVAVAEELLAYGMAAEALRILDEQAIARFTSRRLREAAHRLRAEAQAHQGGSAGAPAAGDSSVPAEDREDALAPAAAGEPSRHPIVRYGSRVVPLDVPPQVVRGRVLVPLRAVGEVLGARVRWDPRRRAAVVEKDRQQVVVPAGSARAYVAGKPRALDVPARLVAGRVLVPLRFVAEAMGVPVHWEERARAVVVGGSR